MSFLYHIRITCLVTIFVILTSCKKDTKIDLSNDAPSSIYSSANISVIAKSDNHAVIWDSLNNTNAAGNIYSVQNINFYISEMTLKRNDGFIYKSNRVFYIDPRISGKASLQLDSIPKGNYTSLAFLIGVDSLRNVDFGLGTTIDNLNMAWPTAMGGGYHFMKVEGHYLDTSNTIQGFAIHLGKNNNLVNVLINQPFNQQNSLHDYSFIFNINEAFKTPYLYDLNVDNNYTMSDSLAMLKIKSNMKDAFSIIQNN